MREPTLIFRSRSKKEKSEAAEIEAQKGMAAYSCSQLHSKGERNLQALAPVSIYIILCQKKNVMLMIIPMPLLKNANEERE
jgi:hypothetical protein